MRNVLFGTDLTICLKALTVLLFCIYEGSDSALDWIRKHKYLVQSLRTFRYADEKNIDQGGPIRTKATSLTEMIEAPEKIELERQKYNKIRAQMGRPGIVDMNGGDTPLDFRKPSHRMTMDLNGTQGRLSNGGAGAPVSPSGLSSPRMSLENNSRKVINGNRPSLSLDGRYSLSLPLQSIKE